MTERTTTSAASRRHTTTLAKRQQKTARRRRCIIVLLALVLLLGLAAGFGYFFLGAGKNANIPFFREIPAAPQSDVTTTTLDANTPLAAAPIRPEHTQTPIVATYKGVDMRLPVATEDLTEVAMHQASYAYALHLATPLKIANTEKSRKRHGTIRAKIQPHGADAIFDGEILQLWRSGRRGKPDTALDVGAKEGSALLSPVDGTVVLVKKYKLYKKHPDFEIHIQPTGRPELDVVLIHVTDPEVAAGDEVSGGITSVGKLRKLSDKMDLQLGLFTAKKDAGNHTHIQLNNAKHPLYVKEKHLKGAIEVK